MSWKTRHVYEPAIREWVEVCPECGDYRDLCLCGEKWVASVANECPICVRPKEHCKCPAWATEAA